MSLGDDEDVRGRFRADVFEGKDVLIVVDFFGGNFAAKDAAEESIGIGHRGLTWRKR